MQKFLIVLLLPILIYSARVESHFHKKEYRQLIKNIHNFENQIRELLDEPMDARDHFNSVEQEQEQPRKLSKNEETDLYLGAVGEIEKRRNEMWNNVIENDLKDDGVMDLDGEGQPSFYDSFMNTNGQPEQCTCSTVSDKEEYLIIAFKDQIDCLHFSCGYKFLTCEVQKQEIATASSQQLENSVHSHQSRVSMICFGSPLKKEFLFEHIYFEGEESVTVFETGPEHNNVRILLKTIPVLRSQYYGKDDEFFKYLKVRKWLAGF